MPRQAREELTQAFNASEIDLGMTWVDLFVITGRYLQKLRKRHRRFDQAYGLEQNNEVFHPFLILQRICGIDLPEREQEVVLGDLAQARRVCFRLHGITMALWRAAQGERGAALSAGEAARFISDEEVLWQTDFKIGVTDAATGVQAIEWFCLEREFGQLIELIANRNRDPQDRERGRQILREAESRARMFCCTALRELVDSQQTPKDIFSYHHKNSVAVSFLMIARLAQYDVGLWDRADQLSERVAGLFGILAYWDDFSDLVKDMQSGEPNIWVACSDDGAPTEDWQKLKRSVREGQIDNIGWRKLVAGGLVKREFPGIWALYKELGLVALRGLPRPLRHVLAWLEKDSLPFAADHRTDILMHRPGVKKQSFLDSAQKTITGAGDQIRQTAEMLRAAAVEQHPLLQELAAAGRLLFDNRMVVWCMDEGCNLGCAGCSKGHVRSTGDRAAVSVDEAKVLVEHFASLGVRMLNLLGGELLRPGHWEAAYEVMATAKENKLYPSCTTNGLFLLETARAVLSDEELRTLGIKRADDGARNLLERLIEGYPGRAIIFSGHMFDTGYDRGFLAPPNYREAFDIMQRFRQAGKQVVVAETFNAEAEDYDRQIAEMIALLLAGSMEAFYAKFAKYQHVTGGNFTGGGPKFRLDQQERERRVSFLFEILAELKKRGCLLMTTWFFLDHPGDDSCLPEAARQAYVQPDLGISACAERNAAGNVASFLTFDNMAWTLEMANIEAILCECSHQCKEDWSGSSTPRRKATEVLHLSLAVAQEVSGNSQLVMRLGKMGARSGWSWLQTEHPVLAEQVKMILEKRLPEVAKELFAADPGRVEQMVGGMLQHNPALALRERREQTVETLPVGQLLEGSLVFSTLVDRRRKVRQLDFGFWKDDTLPVGIRQGPIPPVFFDRYASKKRGRSEPRIILLPYDALDMTSSFIWQFVCNPQSPVFVDQEEQGGEFPSALYDRQAGILLLVASQMDVLQGQAMINIGKGMQQLWEMEEQLRRCAMNPVEVPHFPLLGWAQLGSYGWREWDWIADLAQIERGVRSMSLFDRLPDLYGWDAYNGWTAWWQFLDTIGRYTSLIEHYGALSHTGLSYYLTDSTRVPLQGYRPRDIWEQSSGTEPLRASLGTWDKLEELWAKTIRNCMYNYPLRDSASVIKSFL